MPPPLVIFCVYPSPLSCFQSLYHSITLSSYISLSLSDKGDDFLSFTIQLTSFTQVMYCQTHKEMCFTFFPLHVMFLYYFSLIFIISNVVTQMYSTGKQTNTQDWVHLTLFSNNLEEIQQNQDDIIPKMSPNIGKTILQIALNHLQCSLLSVFSKNLT